MDIRKIAVQTTKSNLEEVRNIFNNLGYKSNKYFLHDSSYRNIIIEDNNTIDCWYDEYVIENGYTIISDVDFINKYIPK